MIELRWRPIRAFDDIPETGMVKIHQRSAPDPLSVMSVEIDCFVVLQYRDGMISYNTKEIVWSLWQDVPIEEE